MHERRETHWKGDSTLEREMAMAIQKYDPIKLIFSFTTQLENKHMKTKRFW